jgi:Virulence protein
MAKTKSTSKHQVIREPLAAQGGEIVFYQAPDGSVKLDVRLEKDTIWLSLNQMAALFDRDKSVISRHLRNVFREGELDRESVVAFFATVQDGGLLYRSDGSRLLSEEELVALALLLAESSPKDKESLVRLTAYLLSSKNENAEKDV